MDLATKDIRIVTTCTLTALRVTRAVIAAKVIVKLMVVLRFAALLGL
jgi:hypothetical protein